MIKPNTKLLVLLEPSIISLSICILLSTGLLLIMALSYQAGKGAVYDFLYGRGSSADLISNSRSTVSALNNTILGNAWLNKILYFAFWMLIGLIVYIILYFILRSTDAAAEGIKESRYVNIKKTKLLQDFAVTLSFRLAAIFGMIVFTVIFLRVLLPFSSLAIKTASDQFISLNGLSYTMAGFLILFLSFHVEVIFMRLALQRVRVFEQQEIRD